MASILKALLGKSGIIKLAMSLLKEAWGKVAMDLLTWVMIEEGHPERDNATKFANVKAKLIAKYGHLKDWGWLLDFMINWAVGQAKGKTKQMEEVE